MVSDMLILRKNPAHARAPYKLPTARGLVPFQHYGKSQWVQSLRPQAAPGLGPRRVVRVRQELDEVSRIRARAAAPGERERRRLGGVPEPNHPPHPIEI
jgi:hypothetical protein